MRQHWRQQAITWANVDPDLCRYMVSLGQNEFEYIIVCIDVSLYPCPMKLGGGYTEFTLSICL